MQLLYIWIYSESLKHAVRTWVKMPIRGNGNQSCLLITSQFSSCFLHEQFWKVSLLETTITHNKMLVCLFLFDQKENIKPQNIIASHGKSCHTISQLHRSTTSCCISLACSLGCAASFDFSWFIADCLIFALHAVAVQGDSYTGNYRETQVPHSLLSSVKISTC